MQEIDLGITPVQNPETGGFEPQEPTFTVIFDEKVKWGDLPFRITVNPQRLTQLMLHADMNSEEVRQQKLLLYWSRSRTFHGFYQPTDNEVKLNVNRFDDNRGRNHLVELHTSEQELKKVELLLNRTLHHEVGHVVEPENVRKASVRQRAIMILGSLSLPEVSFLLKEMSISRPSFAEASLVAWGTIGLLGLSMVWRVSAAPDEIFAKRFAFRLRKDKEWDDIIKLTLKA